MKTTPAKRGVHARVSEVGRLQFLLAPTEPRIDAITST